jgi:ABC-2 type transport system permease protein
MTLTLHYLRLFKELLITDLILLKQKLGDTILNTLIWVTSITLAATYVLPKLGMMQSYGSMVLIGSIASCGIFEIFGNASIMVADLDGERTISYQLTLPLPGWILLAQKAVSYAIHSAILTLFIIPIGKLIMQDHFVLSAIQPVKFIIAYVMLHLMCGFFSLVMTAYTSNMGNILNVWVRGLFPMWFFGGSQFNWYTLKSINPWLGYINLANPLVYAFEAIKAASLADGNFLPFVICIPMMGFFSAVFLFIAHKKLQSRLDYL